MDRAPLSSTASPHPRGPAAFSPTLDVALHLETRGEFLVGRSPARSQHSPMAGDRSVTKCCHLPWGLRSHLPGCRGAGAQLPCGAAWGGGQPPPPARQAARVSWVGARRVRQHSVLCPSTLCAPRPPCHSQLVLGSGSFVLQDERGTAAVPLLPPSPRGAKGSAVSAPGAGCLLATQGTQMQNPNTPQSPNTRPVAHVGTAGTPLLQVHGVAAGHRGAGRRQGNKGQAGHCRRQRSAARSPSDTQWVLGEEPPRGELGAGTSLCQAVLPQGPAGPALCSPCQLLRAASIASASSRHRWAPGHVPQPPCTPCWLSRAGGAFVHDARPQGQPHPGHIRCCRGTQLDPRPCSRPSQTALHGGICALKVQPGIGGTQFR